MLRRCLSVVFCLFLWSCASTSPESAGEAQPPEPDPFPFPDRLEPQVAFWRNVYGVWSRGQTALHDDRYMNLVYEVLDLPGHSDLELGYTPEQRRYVRSRRKQLGEDLASLERKVLEGGLYTPREQALAELIVEQVGPGAILGASERLRSQRGLKERFLRGLEISGRYDGLFRQIFRDAGLPEDLAYLPHVESSFQLHAHSSAGAVGVWQFTKGAARTYMRHFPKLDERRDPVASARGAARYLDDAHDQLEDWALALTSYNHGIGGMKRARREFGTDFASIVESYDGPRFGFSSRNFYASFLAAREVAREPERFFPEGVAYDPPLDWDRVILPGSVRATELARYYEVSHRQLTALNPAWTRRIREGRVAVPAGTEIWLPNNTLLLLAKKGMDDRQLAFADDEERLTQ